MGTEYRKSINFDYDYGYEMSWIEGIGSLRGIITLTAPSLTGSGSGNNLICFRQNNELLYHNSGYDNCFYKNDYNEIKMSHLAKDIILEPNPVLGTCKVSYSAGYYHLQIVNLFGIIVREYNVTGQTSTIINREGLPAGIYFIRLTGQNNSYSILKVIYR